MADINLDFVGPGARLALAAAARAAGSEDATRDQTVISMAAAEQSVEARNEAVAAYQGAGASASIAVTQAERADAAKQAVLALAGLGGVYGSYNTKADADATLAGVPANAVVQVFVDETKGGARTQYQKVSGTYVLRATFPVTALVDIRDFIQSGENLISNGIGEGSNSAIIQRAVDFCNTSWIANGKPVQIAFPDGEYLLAQRGTVGSGTGYAVQWKSGAGIKTNSQRGVIFVCPVAASAFVAADNALWENISNVYCDPHIVDGRRQTNATYTSKFKGWFLQGLFNSIFVDVCVINTFSTGFGCDYLVNTKITGVARNCGRGLKELAVDPLTTSGGSGFGIGNGRFEYESSDLDVEAYDCGFHGVFYETQGSQPYKFSKGVRCRAYVKGNHTGFRDCGCDGIEATIVSGGNTYAEILHDQTILNDVMGINGRVRVNLADGLGKGILLGAAAQKGPYVFQGQIKNCAGGGVGTKASASLPDNLTLDLDITGCGNDAVSLDKANKGLVLKIRERNNSGYGIALRGASTCIDLTISDADVRSGGALIQQPLVGDARVGTTVRGIELTNASALRTTPTGSNAVKLNWTAPLQTAGLADYSIQFKRPEDSAWTTYAHTASTAIEVTISGLDLGHSYQFRGAAVFGSTTGNYTTAVLGVAGIANVQDSFNRANADLNGQSAPDGTTAAVWSSSTSAAGVLGVSSSTVAKATAGGAVFTTVPAAAKGGAQVTLSTVHGTATTRRQLLLFRYQDNSNYWALSARVSGTNLNIGLRKVVAGAITEVASYNRQAASGDVLRAEFNGDRIAWYVNDEFVGAVTDAALNTQMRSGIEGEFTTDSQGRFDNFRVWS